MVPDRKKLVFANLVCIKSSNNIESIINHWNLKYFSLKLCGIIETFSRPPYITKKGVSIAGLFLHCPELHFLKNPRNLIERLLFINYTSRPILRFIWQVQGSPLIIPIKQKKNIKHFFSIFIFHHEFAACTKNLWPFIFYLFMFFYFIIFSFNMLWKTQA